MPKFRPSPVICLRTTYEAFGGRVDALAAALPVKVLREARRVAVKINLCDARTPETGAVTDPRVLDAVMGWVRRANPTCGLHVVESDGIAVLADNYRKWFGVDEILTRWRATWVNLSREEPVPVRIDGSQLREVPVPKVLTESVLISLSKLKTNLLSTITCALKNQFGCLPMVDKFKYHPVLADVIVDINRAVRAHLYVVDGIIALGGIQGPAFGTPIPAGVVLAGVDPVAVDAACCKVMGYRPLAVAHVRKCWLAELGSLRYWVAGDPLPEVDFENRTLETAVFRVGGGIKRLYQRLDRRRSA